ncbi:hypothetical protein KJ611_01720 [Patescibacteria group bacterium]|nr:hypothetical protein [Patescibacteria group bacterium]MBU1705138.1 hypothetical protein [Patescibacteria group bacterium]
MSKNLDQFLAALARAQAPQFDEKEERIAVSDTVSVAASVYENIRNTLEYDEEHLLRRNAIRRILKRRLAEEDREALAGDLLRELIWARYLPNKKIPESLIGTLAQVFAKYHPLFENLESDSQSGGQHYQWLLDVLSTEIEYLVSPPLADEALASFAYQELKSRLEWHGGLVKDEDRDLQLYAAVHRTVLKSNNATLRFRLLTLYYPEWLKAGPNDSVVAEIANHLDTVIDSVEKQISHPAADSMFRLVRGYAVVFHLLRDIAEDDPSAFAQAVVQKDTASLERAIGKAAKVRYERFYARQRRGVFRAVTFLFLSKFVLALLIEMPYERLILQTTNWLPLTVNVIFHPLLLGLIGLTVNIPQKKNTARITELALGVLRVGDDFNVNFRVRRPWAKGALAQVFRLLYTAFFLLTIGVISYILHGFDFNYVSIAFFLFFLSLVTYFGLKVRNRRRELVIIDTESGFFATLIDILFLPIIRAGRWMALKAPRINIFLFFFDFIVEAPFKAAIRLIEGWLAFLKEKREEI